MKIMTNGLFLQIKSLSGNPNGFPDKLFIFKNSPFVIIFTPFVRSIIIYR